METKIDRRKNKVITDESVVRRILAKCKVNTDTCCIEWQGHRAPTGHGQTTYKGKLTSVHRVLYMASHGVTLTSKQHICHKCDNPPCCNLDHHFLGDAKANMRDMIRKGRDAFSRGVRNLPVGERAHLAKITDAQEFEIRAMLKAGMGPTAIYRTGRFPITARGISSIKHGKCRKHNHPTQTK
jgi:hypothetical protein